MHLREDERIHIADRLREKASIRAIAAELGRAGPRSAERSGATATSAAGICPMPRTGPRPDGAGGRSAPSS